MHDAPNHRERAGLWLHGSTGRMGLEIRKACADDHANATHLHLLGGSARIFEDFCGTAKIPVGSVVTAPSLGQTLRQVAWELLLDFSTLDGNQTLLHALSQPSPLKGQAIVLGTTGMSQETLAQWHALAHEQRLRLLVAPNTSIGILLLAKAALLAAPPLRRLGFDIEIVETHHRLKKDAPSGTARFLAQTVADGVGDLSIVTDRHGARQSSELGVHAVRGGGVFGEHTIRLIGDSEEISLSHRAFSRTLFAQGALVLGNWALRQQPGVYGLLDIDLSDLGVV